MSIATRLLLPHLLLGCTTAWAHSVWIDLGSANATLSYGEPEVAQREQSPGKLDELELIELKRLDKAEFSPFKTQIGTDGYVLGSLVSGSSFVAQLQRKSPYQAPGQGTASRIVFYARAASWPLQAAKPALDLDIVPMAGSAQTFTVFFKGQALRGGTLKALAPNLWLQVHDIDEKGQVRIHMPWRGAYVLDVEHKESSSGTQAGQAYDTVRHRASLSFVQPKGQAAGSPQVPQFHAH